MRLVAHRKQPKDVRFGSFDPYYLSVFENDIDWRGFPIELRRRYSTYVARESPDPSYGHFIDFTFYTALTDTHDIITAFIHVQTNWGEGAGSEGVKSISTTLRFGNDLLQLIVSYCGTLIDL